MSAEVCSRIVFLTLGSELVPRSLSLEDGGDEVVELPICGALVRAPVGWVLLETGMDGESDRLVRELARCGVAPGDLALAALSHFHVDHAGGLGVLADAGVPVVVQRRELAFARSPAAREQDYVEAIPDAIAWRELDGDGAVTPGIDALATPGHTPGHMSYRVWLSDRTYLLAIDAIDLQEGIDRDVCIGSSADPADAPLRRASHDRLVALARAEGAELVPGHCPVTWPRRPGPPDGVTGGSDLALTQGSELALAAAAADRPQPRASERRSCKGKV